MQTKLDKREFQFIDHILCYTTNDVEREPGWGAVPDKKGNLHIGVEMFADCVNDIYCVYSN